MNWLHGKHYDYPEGYGEENALWKRFRQKDPTSVTWARNVVDHDNNKTLEMLEVPYAELPERTQAFRDAYVKRVWGSGD